MKPYPVNTGRNIARDHCKSDYFLVADMEQEFSYFAESNLRFLLNKYELYNSRAILVVRRFEYDSRMILPPRSMLSLNETIGRRTFAFHWFYWKQGHIIPQLREWLNMTLTDTPLILEYPPSESIGWEPMFLAHKSIPYHNEDYIYGIEDHASLVKHLCVASYAFIVAPEVFSLHKGIRKGGSKTPKLYAHDIKRSTVAKQEFAHQLMRDYGDRVQKC